MNCPICNFSELNDGATICSQCQSNIEVFIHLEDARKRHHFQKKLIAGLIVLLIIVVVGWGYTRFSPVCQSQKNEISATTENPVAQEFATGDSSDEYLKKENGKLTAEISSLKAEIKSLNEKPNTNELSTSGNVIIHVVVEGESLWRIAQKYYKDGYQYKKIANENSLTDMQNIQIGTKLKIQN